MSVLRRLPGAIAIGLEVALVTAVGYLTILTAAAWWGLRRRRPGAAGAPRHRIAVLVPAHDEERLIGATLDSLRAMDYPPELFAVHVVADNCADGTADVVRARGFDVHERHDTAAPGKGPALQWLMARLDQQGATHDAVAFVDADTVADPGFLRAVDRALSAGHVVVQGHYAVRDEGVVADRCLPRCRARGAELPPTTRTGDDRRDGRVVRQWHGLRHSGHAHPPLE